MSKKYFDDEKLQYENIEIPEELDFMVKKALKDGREKRKVKTIYKYGIGVASTFLVFVLLVNMFPTVAYAMSKVPGLDKLVELVTFDKGFDNAVEEGLVKEVNFEEEKNGVRLKVNTIAGDWKRLWVGYEINIEEGYGVDIRIVDKNTGEGIGSIMWSVLDGINPDENNSENYLEVGFNEFVEEFVIEFNIYDKKNELENVLNENYIASFNVPIKLESEIFNSQLRAVNLDNNIVSTEVGDIEIISLKTCKTRTVIEFKLNSNKYDYMNFENPRLIDNEGNEYKASSFMEMAKEGSDNRYIELQGEIKENIKKLTFKFDSMYYAGKDNRSIMVDLKNKIVEPNDYNFEFEDLIGDELILKAEGVESVSFENIILDNGDDLLSESGVSCIGDEDSDEYYVKSYFKLKDTNVDKVELKIFWIMKDKVNGNSIDLISK